MIHSPTKTFIMKTSNFALIWFAILVVAFSSALILGKGTDGNQSLSQNASFGLDYPGVDAEPIVLADAGATQPGDDLIYQLCYSRCGDPTLVVNNECWVQCRMYYFFRKR
jgi:hypothetical protein